MIKTLTSFCCGTQYLYKSPACGNFIKPFCHFSSIGGYCVAKWPRSTSTAFKPRSHLMTASPSRRIPVTSLMTCLSPYGQNRRRQTDDHCIEFVCELVSCNYVVYCYYSILLMDLSSLHVDLYMIKDAALKKFVMLKSSTST